MLSFDEFRSLLFEPAISQPGSLGQREDNSISDGADDGSIDKLATEFWAPLRHTSIQQYRKNMDAERRDVFPAPAPGSPETRNQNIAGHGSPGFVETGAGQNVSSSDYIAFWNENYWGWHLALAGKDRDGGLTIWSCLTGASWNGADLLFRIAKQTNRSVRARTGLLLLVTQGNRRWVEFQKGSTWQTATPDMTEPPDPIAPPALPAGLKMMQPDAPFSGFVGGEIQRFVEGKWDRTTLSGPALDSLLQLLFENSATQRAGTFPAIVTAKLSLHRADGSRLSGRILADAVLEIDEPASRFFLSPNATERLAALA
jgi:hypothetical protein